MADFKSRDERLKPWVSLLHYFWTFVCTATLLLFLIPSSRAYIKYVRTSASTYVRSLIYSLTHSLTQSAVRWSPIHPSIHPSMHAFSHSFVHARIHCYPCNLCTDKHTEGRTDHNLAIDLFPALCASLPDKSHSQHRAEVASAAGTRHSIALRLSETPNPPGPPTPKPPAQDQGALELRSSRAPGPNPSVLRSHKQRPTVNFEAYRGSKTCSSVAFASDFRLRS